MTQSIQPVNTAGINTQLFNQQDKKDQLGYSKSYKDGSEMIAGLIHLPRYDFIYFYKVSGNQMTSYTAQNDDLALLENRILALSTDLIHTVFRSVEEPYQKAMQILDHLQELINDHEEKGDKKSC